MYYSKIEAKARERWDQLEHDPDLAGPWHQLFRQVQSPRHVVSELLQNADDAGATMASVRIEGGAFLFEHDGGDFDEEQFASLCRFGFSNKRTMHTIGFRGVGFKSTFSLGNIVEVYSPTVAACFKKERFTQPIWLHDADHANRTVIKVRIANQARESELRKNFEEWARSPVSLLFFNSLKELSIDGCTVKRQVLEDGPVPESSWVRLEGADKNRLLVVSDEPERLPDEAVEEIRGERGIGSEDLHIPPCRVEVVLGLPKEQRLYVVLPTGAKLRLPFSCNAPFIQDPARFAIKDPSLSPTNRWLLGRTGRLVGRTMLQWLGTRSLSLGDRSKAYDLLKEATQFEPGLDGACSKIIMDTIESELDAKRFVITTEGDLVERGACVAVPAMLYSVWEPRQLTKLFAPESDHLLASEVSTTARTALRSHKWLKEINADESLKGLELSETAPRPESWSQLHALWSFVQKEIKYDWNNERRRRMRIVPVEGSETLHSANQVIRLSSKRDLLSQSDWQFIMDNVSPVDADWLAWISARAPVKSATPNDQVDPAYDLLQILGLSEPSSADRIAAQASAKIFGGKSVPVVNCVRIARIMAALGATVPGDFRYVTRDLHIRDTTSSIVVDKAGRFEDLVPIAWAQTHFLHHDYFQNFESHRADVWDTWAASNKSSLLAFVPIVEERKQLYSRSNVRELVKSRGAQQPVEFHYRRDDFTVMDYGLPPDLMKHWEKIAKDDPNIWSRVLEGILSAPKHLWEKKIEAEVRHNGHTYYKALNCGFLPPQWIAHFRSLRCIPDTHGRVHMPAEVMLRTPDTEPLMGVEPFIRSELDNEVTKPLLRLLGVRDTPTGATKLLSRLHALSITPDPIQLLSEISRIYEALDRIVVRCTPNDLKPIVDTFSQVPLILTSTGEWVTPGELSIIPDEENHSPTVYPSLRSLAIWPRIGVSERPALERTIEWLRTLAPGVKLEPTTVKRVRAAIQRDPVRIWNECRHWLSLNSTWEPIDTIKYRLTMQALVKWGELFPSIKSSTANLQMITVDVAQQSPFVNITNLADIIEFRITKLVESRPSNMPETGWLPMLANRLSRVRFPSNEETTRVRIAAQRLRQTIWHVFKSIDVTPYVVGIPAGEPFSPKVLWQDENLYVSAESQVRLFKELVEELSRPFSHPQVSDAIAACIERTGDFLAEYFEAHFELDPEVNLEATQSSPGSETSASPTEEEESTTIVGTPDDSNASAADGNNKPPEVVNEHEDPNIPPSRPPQPPKPTLIEIYTRGRRFCWSESQKSYVHQDGSSIQRCESPFNWQEIDPAGIVLNRFFVSEQKLSNGVQIAAELWALISQYPSSTILLVHGDDNEPFALSGKELVALKDSGQLELYPAHYRIVLQNH